MSLISWLNNTNDKHALQLDYYRTVTVALVLCLTCKWTKDQIDWTQHNLVAINNQRRCKSHVLARICAIPCCAEVTQTRFVARNNQQ